MAKIIVDYREKNSGIIQELAKRDVDAELKQLNVADFVISEKIGIEKKTDNDFLNSIIDKRIIKQLTALKENFELPLLIIEGENNIYSLRDFHPNSIRGMLSSIVLEYQIPILYTKTIADTAALLAVIAKKQEKIRTEFGILGKRKPLTIEQQKQLIIECFPGVGPRLAKNLLKEFKSVKNIVNASEKELTNVEKIGKKKAENIKKVVEHEK